jgi:hypothetical protein
MNKITTLILLLFIIFATSSCKNDDKTTIYIIKSTGTIPTRWEYECLPEGYISLIETGETLSSKISFLAPGRSQYYKFKAEKSGEFTMYWVCYENIDWLLMDESYVVDYVINENLEIQQVGMKRPIYEIEKFDRELISRFTKGFSQRIEWALDDYPDVSYLVVNDYDSKLVNVEVKDYKNSDKNAIKEIIENCLNEAFVELGEIMDGYIINITFDHSDINSNSDNDDISSED